MWANNKVSDFGIFSKLINRYMWMEKHALIMLFLHEKLAITCLFLHSMISDLMFLLLMDLRLRTTPYTDAEIKVIYLFTIIHLHITECFTTIHHIGIIKLYDSFFIHLLYQPLICVTYGYNWHFIDIIWWMVGLAPFS